MDATRYEYVLELTAVAYPPRRFSIRRFDKLNPDKGWQFFNTYDQKWLGGLSHAPARCGSISEEDALIAILTKDYRGLKPLVNRHYPE